jgi:hypothetical protein
VRAPCSGHRVSADEAARWSRDRGRKSTGSYEGSLTMEGIPDHHEPQVFTGRRSRWSRRLLHTRQRKRRAGEGRARSGWKRERRQGCQRLGRSRAPWEENAHARSRSRPTTCEARGQGHTTRIQNVVSSTIRRSESSAVKALGPPVKPSGAQTPGGAHAVKAAAGSRERTRCGCTQFRSGGRSRSDASRVLPVGRLQGLVTRNKAGR